MTEQQMRARGRYVIGPDGSPLTVADLPPRDTKRWVIRRKAEVVAAVRGGLLSMEEACERYTLTVDEFLSWQRSIDKHGLPGLRATRVQDYREWHCMDQFEQRPDAYENLVLRLPWERAIRGLRMRRLAHG